MKATFSVHGKAQRGASAKGAWSLLRAPESELKAAPGSKAPTPYTCLYESNPLRCVDLARDGVPASAIALVAQALGMPVARVLKALNLPASTMASKTKSQKKLSVDQSERLIQAMRLIGLAQRLVGEYGDPQLSQGFDAARWFGKWLEEPNPALGMQKPAGLLDTAAGAGLVESVMHKMVCGACA